MSKCKNQIKYTDSLTMSECTDGFWLYDETRGMNLAMAVNSQEKAFIQALEYYQKRLKATESSLESLRGKVSGFIDLFVIEVDYGSSSDIPSTVLEVNI